MTRIHLLSVPVEHKRLSSYTNTHVCFTQFSFVILFYFLFLNHQFSNKHYLLNFIHCKVSPRFLFAVLLVWFGRRPTAVYLSVKDDHTEQKIQISCQTLRDKAPVFLVFTRLSDIRISSVIHLHLNNMTSYLRADQMHFPCITWNAINALRAFSCPWSHVNPVIHYWWRAVIFVASTSFLKHHKFVFYSSCTVTGTCYLWPLSHSLTAYVAV